MWQAAAIFAGIFIYSDAVPVPDSAIPSQPLIYWVIELIKALVPVAAIPVGIGGSTFFAILINRWLNRPKKDQINLVITRTATVQDLCDQLGAPRSEGNNYGFGALGCYVLDLHNGTKNLNGQHIQNWTVEAEYARPMTSRLLPRIQNQRIRGEAARVLRSILEVGPGGWYIEDVTILPEEQLVWMRRYRHEVCSTYWRLLYDKRGAPVKIFVLDFSECKALSSAQAQAEALAAAESMESLLQ